VLWKDSNISEVHAASIFGVKRLAMGKNGHRYRLGVQVCEADAASLKEKGGEWLGN
jgi:hypothetical protein